MSKDDIPNNSKEVPNVKNASGLAIKFRAAFNRARGLPVEIDLSAHRRTIDQIHAFQRQNALHQTSDAELGALSRKLRARLASEPHPEKALVDAFALVYEACSRAIGLVPHDVQMIAGLAMLERKIAELPTGEGKTLAAVFPAYLQALSGRGIHILTFNDYLARRDAAWMGPIYRLLGLDVGFVQEGMSKPEKQTAYACDITYATAKEAGFDFLRDQIAHEVYDLVHRPFYMALVDEADSILVDEARIPLVISGAAGELNVDAERLAPLVLRLVPGLDYQTDEEKRNVFPTDAGLEKLEQSLGCGDLYSPQNEQLLAAIHCALHAEVLLQRDVDYIVRNEHIEIVDEFTGRIMEKRQWPDGLQAAVEAKENLFRKSEGRILGSITLQHYFRLYPKLCGMTATARPSAAELEEFYGLNVAVIPPHRPCIRVDHPDVVFTHKKAKTRALIREIAGVHATGRPVLVGTLSVRESEELAAALRESGVRLEVLNARNDELEAKIISEAGRFGAVTISTNMAGRGTDIRLGGGNEAEREEVAALGGLYVIGTNRHESLRIDRQLRGRSGRQGDPGSSRFFISLEDEIFERYGLRTRFFTLYRLDKQDDDVDDPVIRRDIVHAQKVIEGQNFDIRKTLRLYSELIETERKIVQQKRENILLFRDATWEKRRLPPTLRTRGITRFGPQDWEEILRQVRLFHLDRCWSDHLAFLADVRESIHIVSLGGKEPLHEFHRSAVDAFAEMEKQADRVIIKTLRELVKKQGPVDLAAEGLKGPTSTWTYLVNEDQFGWGVELLKGKNLGFAVGAAAFMGPLFVFTLLMRRLRRRKKRAMAQARD
jgi:preprotein translocase subunit SecA